MSLTIRPSKPEDLPRLQETRAAAFEPVFSSVQQMLGEELSQLILHHTKADQAAQLETLCGTDSDAALLVALVDEEIVGFVSYTVQAEKQLGEIGLNAVHPAHAGAGIGTALYNRACEEMARQGVRVVEVSTGGDLSHAPARRAYEKAGFGHPLATLCLFRKL